MSVKERQTLRMLTGCGVWPGGLAFASEGMGNDGRRASSRGRRVGTLFGSKKCQKRKDNMKNTHCGVWPGDLAVANARGWGMTGNVSGVAGRPRGCKREGMGNDG